MASAATERNVTEADDAQVLDVQVPKKSPGKYGTQLVTQREEGVYDVVVPAVAYREFRELGANGERTFGEMNR